MKLDDHRLDKVKYLVEYVTNEIVENTTTASFEESSQKKPKKREDDNIINVIIKSYESEI